MVESVIDQLYAKNEQVVLKKDLISGKKYFLLSNCHILVDETVLFEPDQNASFVDCVIVLNGHEIRGGKFRNCILCDQLPGNYIRQLEDASPLRCRAVAVPWLLRVFPWLR